jgi:cobalt-zinc-cadmium resistance protein CzcA
MLAAILRFSIQHRYLVLLLTLGVAAVGAASLARLPIDAVPDITNNQVQINTEFPELSPIEIEKLVTFPVETALAGIPGLESTRSLSRNGFSQVTAIFRDDVDIYFARQQVGERLGEARRSLPPGAEPTMGPIATGLSEIYMYAVEFAVPEPGGVLVADGEPGFQSDGDYLTPERERLVTDVEKGAYLRTVQDWIIRPQLRTVRGVAGIDSIGGYEKQYHVQPDPMKLVAYGLTFHDVIEALERNNVSAGAGFIERNGESYIVRTDGRVRSLAEIAEIVVGERRGTPVYIRDVADAIVGRELRTGVGSKDAREAVIGTALMLIGENSRTVAADVDAELAEIAQSLPSGIRVTTVLDRTELVNKTIRTVRNNLIEGAILVIVILFLLLGNFRAALITACAIPLSMLIAATGMVRGGISGNLMSLGAIDFGIIVDGAVIVVENCLRMLAEKQGALNRRLTLKERLHEVMVASRQMIQPSVAGQAIIIIVYLPILTLTGVEGKMFRPMAGTVILALAGAFVLSLTFVPAMVAIFVTDRVTEKENRIVALVGRIYAPVLRLGLRLRWLVVAGALAVFAGSMILFKSLGQEFVPTLDEGDIAMHAMRIPSTGIGQSAVMQLDVERTLGAFPEVDFVFSKTGTAEVASDPMPPNVSDTFIMLKPRDAWPDPAETKGDFQERIEAALGLLPGNNYEFTQPIQMRFNELISGVRSDVAVKIYGDEFDVLVPAAEAIARVLSQVPGAADVKVEQTEGLPVMSIDVDRAAVARYGLSVADVQDVVAVAIGGREAGLVFEGDRRFELIVRLPDDARRDPATLENLPIPLPDHSEEFEPARLASMNASGALPAAPFIPLSSLATITIEDGPNQISRENGKRRIVVQANVRGRDLGGFVVEARQRLADEFKRPPGTWLDWGGQFENLAAARQRLIVVVPVSFLLILLVLFGAFNSVKYALLVFSGVPLALTGGIVALWLRGIPFSISAAVGFIALSGVAVLNGLVMVTYINHLRRRGIGLDAAIEEGSLTRLRPVLMTALVASLGFVPMALATGTGAEVQKPLATVVIGGIVTSTFLTLVVLPALYRIWHRKDDKLVDEDDTEHLSAAAPVVD